MEYKNFNNNVLDYDIKDFDLRTYVEKVIKEIFPDLKELEKIHEQVDASTLFKIQKHVEKSCDRVEFMEMVDKFIKKYVSPLIDHQEYLIQRYGVLRAVIPNQLASGRLLSFHQGIWVGNGKGLRTIWTPITKCWGSNSMQMLDLEISRKLTKQCLDEKWDFERIQNESLKYSFPVELVPGQSWLFNQECIHGNVNNETDITRFSMDLRILLKDKPYHRKFPGGYFRLPGDYVKEEKYKGDENFVTYAGWNSKFSYSLPLPMQRAITDSYCKQKNINISDYQFENEYLDWLPNLRSFINEKPKGIILTSLFCLPDNKEWRDEILELALEKNVELHFANELTVLRQRSDLENIQKYREWSTGPGSNYME